MSGFFRWLVLAGLCYVPDAGRVLHTVPLPPPVACSAPVLCTLSVGDLSFTVAPREGGKIVSFRLKGQEMLVPDSVHPIYYGSTLWISPQSEYWPQYPEVDRLPYEAQCRPGKIRLTGRVDPVNGIQVIKEFTAVPADTSIALCYTIRNEAAQTKKLAAWEVTRVFDGFSFFPIATAGVAAATDLEGYTVEDGLLSFFPPAHASKKGQKLFAAAQCGWSAYYYKGVLFLKSFPEVAGASVPPGQGAVEIYRAPNGSYLELETHGAYTELPPGGTLQYRQRWTLRAADGKSKKGLRYLAEHLHQKMNDLQ